MLFAASLPPPMATRAKIPTTTSLNPDVEPDERWKANLRNQIEEGLRDMFDDAKKRFEDKLKEGPVGADDRDTLVREHTATMKNIRGLAEEQFLIGLERERQERRWATNAQMAPEWNAALVKEQQSILDNIHKDDTQSEKSTHRASSPTDDRSQLGARASVKAQHDASYPSPISYQGANVSPSAERPSMRWSSGTLVEEPEGMESSDEQPLNRRPNRIPERTFEHNERPARSPAEVDPAWRLPASSPPKPIPEFWKPPISPADDAAASRRHISRRGSAASIGSIGSTNYRSSIRSQIPECPSESVDVDGDSEKERTRPQAAEQEWKSPAKAREREWPGLVRTASETSNLRLEEPVVSPMSSVRAADGQSRAYLPTSITNRQSSQSLRSETFVPISPSRPAESQSTMYTPSSTITNQHSSQNLQTTYVPTPVPISPLRHAGSQSRLYHPHSAISRQPSQNLRAEESSYVPTPVLVSPSRLAESHSRSHPPSSARPIVRKRPSQVLVFDEEPSPVSAGLTSSSWLESPARPYAPTPYSGRSITSKASSIFDDSGHQSSPTARAASRSPADSRYERDMPRSAYTYDDDLRSPMRPLRARSSTLDTRFDQQDRHYPDRHRHSGDSDDEYGDMVEQGFGVEPQTRRRAEGHGGWDEEAKRREAAWLRGEAARLEEELAEDGKKREEEEKRRLREEELSRKEEEARRLEEEAKRMEEDARRKEEDAKRKEEDAKRKEEDAKKKEEEAKRKEEEAKKKEQEARLKEAEARRKEEAAHQKEVETRKKELEIRKREEEVKRREEELNRREAEAKLKDKEKQDLQQQEEFRKREEEIRRRADERKRQDSAGSYSEGRDWAGSTTYPSASPTTPTAWSGLNRSGSTSTSATDKSSASSSGRSGNASWSSSTRPSSTSSTQASGTPRPPTTPTTPTSAKPGGGQPPSPAMSESEWARRQAEQAKKQQEQFRLEQERLERDRQAKAGKIMTKEEVIQLFETHLRQWAQLNSYDTLHWNSFPWPVLKRPSVPDELTTTAIGAYVLSPHYPGDAAKPSKDRIKEHIKRWHPDRFETKLLPKVIEGEREKVKQGAGLVARCLNDLLTRSNVSNVFS